MKKFCIFTNSEELSEKFNIPNINNDELLKSWIFSNVKEMNEERLFLLKIALDFNANRQDIFIVLNENYSENFNGKIIGGSVIGYNESGWSFVERFKFAMKSLSIAPDFQGKGLSKPLIQAIFVFFESKKIAVLKQSSYTEEGYNRIRKNFSKIAANYPTIDFVDPEKDWTFFSKMI